MTVRTRALATIAVICMCFAASARCEDATAIWQTLVQKKLDVAIPAYDGAYLSWQRGLGDVETVYRWSKRWMDAEVQLAKTTAEKATAADKHLARMRGFLAEATKRMDVGQVTVLDSKSTEWYVAEAEELLLSWKSAPPAIRP